MLSRYLATILLALHANVCTGQEVAPSIRPVLELVAYTHSHLKYCDFRNDTDGAQKTVDSALIALSEALHIRALALGKKEEDVLNGVSDFIALITSEPQNLASFRQRCPDTIQEQINLLESNIFRNYLEDYISLPGTYDRPFTLSGTELETYAGPSTQRYLLDTIGSRMAPCTDIKPVTVTLNEKTIDPHDNLPVFVAPTITFTESWSVECDGQLQRFEIIHARDSEGPNGLYTVRLD